MVVNSLIGRFREARQEAQALKKKKEVWPSIQRGRQLVEAYEVDEAIEFLTQATQRFPESAELHCLYASVLEDKRPEDAVLEAGKAIKLEPDDPVLLTRVAQIMLGVGETEAARRYVAHARELSESDFLFAPELDHLESHFAMADGDEEAAEKGFRRSVEREPESAVYALDLATFLADRGRSEEAVEVIDRAVERVKWKDKLRQLRAEIVDEKG